MTSLNQTFLYVLQYCSATGSRAMRNTSRGDDLLKFCSRMWLCGLWNSWRAKWESNQESDTNCVERKSRLSLDFSWRTSSASVHVENVRPEFSHVCVADEIVRQDGVAHVALLLRGSGVPLTRNKTSCLPSQGLNTRNVSRNKTAAFGVTKWKLSRTYCTLKFQRLNVSWQDGT